MAGRPKSNTPKKQKLTLTVDTQTRLELAYISSHTGESISSLVSTWAKKEAQRIAKRAGEELPSADQMTIDDLE